MNELQLSTDINVITAEINSYKQVAGHSFIEIGRRLLHVNENNLAYGDWSPFLESIQMSNSQARRFMKIAKEYDMGKLPNVGQIGFTAMYEIATLPEEKRHEAINEDGTAKSVREIRELKSENKKLEQAKQQAEQQAEIERKERERVERENQELANKEPKEIKVVPDDYNFYKSNYEATKRVSEQYKEDNKDLREELKTLHEQLKNNAYIDTKELENLKEQESKITKRLDSYEKINDVQQLLEALVSKVSKKQHSLFISNDLELWRLEEFENSIIAVEKICAELKDKLPDKNIIEGDVIDV